MVCAGQRRCILLVNCRFLLIGMGYYAVEESADILTEFLEVAVHTILYCRNIYPHGVFGRKKKYNVPVQMCLHPEVNQYVRSACESVRALLVQRAVQRMDVVLLGSGCQPLERFTFEISTADMRGKGKSDEYLLVLEQSLRALLLKLNTAECLLQPLPADCSWTFHLHTNESSTACLQDQLVSEDFSWIEADENEQYIEQPQLVPLKTLASHLFKIQLYAEESAQKTKD